MAGLDTGELEALEMARALDEAHRARAPYTPMLAGRPEAIGFAYDVQSRLIASRSQAGAGAIVAWKIGMTTAHMQALTGLGEPASGAILAHGRQSSGDVLSSAGFVHLGLEGEIAVRVGQAFPETAAIDPELVLGRLDSVAAALEVTDDRNADWTTLDAPSLIADNIWNIGMVLGPPSPAHAVRTLTGRRGILTINGEVREQGLSQHIGCDPLWIIAWLGAHLARRGQPLQPGQWILTGSFVSTTFPQPGDRYSFAVDGLGVVEALVS